MDIGPVASMYALQEYFSLCTIERDQVYCMSCDQPMSSTHASLMYFLVFTPSASLPKLSPLSNRREKDERTSTLYISNPQRALFTSSYLKCHEYMLISIDRRGFPRTHAFLTDSCDCPDTGSSRTL